MVQSMRYHPPNELELEVSFRRNVINKLYIKSVGQIVKHNYTAVSCLLICSMYF